MSCEFVRGRGVASNCEIHSGFNRLDVGGTLSMAEASTLVYFYR